MQNTQIRASQSSELLEAFINNTPMGVAIIDDAGQLNMANTLVGKFLDVSIDLNHLENYNLLRIVEDIPELYVPLNEYLADKGLPFSIESIFINNYFFTLNAQVILGGYIVTIEDITSQKELEANSIQSILEGQENERRRIGREIHDGIGPLLSYMKLSLEAFTEDLNQKQDSISTAPLHKLSETIDSITSDLRLLSHNLVPRLLEEFGLTSAFENMVLRFNESKKMNISFYSNIEKDYRINSDLELNLYRCGQELVSNAVKYANSKTIIVQLILHQHSVILMVEDDGNGFSKEDLVPENFGIGLTNIDTRVRMLNGDFNLESSLGKGTVASIEFQL